MGYQLTYSGSQTADAIRRAVSGGEIQQDINSLQNKVNNLTGFHVLGHYDTLAELQAAVTSPSGGDCYSVGTATPYTAYVWNAGTSAWDNYGAIGATTGAVRYDEAQSLSSAEKTQALSNIAGASVGQIGSLGNAIGMRGWNQLSNLGAEIKNTTTDTATTLRLRLTLNASPFTSLIQFTFTSANKFSGIFTATFSGAIQLQHNGSSTNITLASAFASVVNGHKYFTSGHASGIDPTTVNGIVIEDFQLIDLTALFGSGNEPSTVAEFRAMFPADFYPYCNGQFADLLWTRADSGSFPSQTISLDLSNYEMCLIVSLDTSTGTTRHTNIITKNMNCIENFISRANEKLIARLQTMINSGITFGNGLCYSTYGTVTVDNAYCVPYQIYGIR